MSAFRMKNRILKGTLYYRLMSYFLIVMLIPLLMLTLTYFSAGNRTIGRNLVEQGELAIDRAAIRLKTIIESYRHKAYVISTDETVIAELSANAPEASSSRSKAIYETLFSVMRGDTYLASATVVSSSGQVRYSTHLFPKRYDIRYNQNDFNPFFNLSRTASETASVITTENRYSTETNASVFLNIYRKVRDSTGLEIGYVAVDVFYETLFNINDRLVFSDLILIDTSNYLANSLINSDLHGDFSKFPALKSLHAPFDQRSIVENTTIISLAPIANTSFVIAGITDITPYRQSVEHFFIILVIIVLLGTVIAGFLSYFFTKTIEKPVNTLAKTMRKVESGDLSVHIEESSIAEFAQLDRTFNAMISQIVNLIKLTREEEEKVREAERKALHSQMNPHFLFNTLNTVKALASLHGEEQILTITTKLGKLLREIIDNRNTEQTLENSLDLVANYLAIQKIRYGDKLTATIDMDKHLAHMNIPRLIIQPLVENAIIHGLEPKIGQWTLHIGAHVVGQQVIISIQDNGIGITDIDIPEHLEDLAYTEHVGIYNIYRRLQLRYGDQAKLTIATQPGEGTTVTIILPIAAEENV
ncbi:MAG: sensor histidine kinase [Sphaerochaetaceae bacterium]